MAELTLRPPQYLVSRRAIGYWAAKAALAWLILTAVEVVIWLNNPDQPAWIFRTVVLVTVALAVVHLAIMPIWRFRVHRWERTDEAVYTQSGWLTVERRIAPISRIQTVDSEMGLFERLFGLSNVTVTTASAAGPLKIHGLARSTARDLVDDLIRNTQATAGDAT
jgi:membrane protein YdbS with pleckstrin-like domain